VVLENDGEDQLERQCEKERYYVNSRKKEQLPTIEGRKTTWTGHILRTICLQKYVIEGSNRKLDRGDEKTRKKL